MVRKLSIENFQKARSYLMHHGRDLEQALFRFYFKNGHARNVITLLEQHQGSNGGFYNMGEGHASIPNGMDTCMAFQYLSEVGATHEEAVVQKGIQYIINSYDQTSKCWHPRPNQTSKHWTDNPCAELVGYLHEYHQLVPENFLMDVTDIALSSMRNIHTTEESLQFYFLEALSVLRLAIRVDEPYQSKILAQLHQEIEFIIETDSSKWSTTYCAKPYFFATAPDPIFSSIKEHVFRSLENEMDTQAEDGHFILNWDCDAEGAKVWKSIWTMDVLKVLHHHDLIEK